MPIYLINALVMIAFWVGYGFASYFKNRKIDMLNAELTFYRNCLKDKTIRFESEGE